jgi:hypothetical protein
MPTSSFDQTEEYFRGFYQGFRGDADPTAGQLTGEDRFEFDRGVKAGEERNKFVNGNQSK